MELKNPFGLRDNKIILIEDLPANENGLRCNCVCPACGEPFEARMGNIRRHHFAHSGEGCDFVNAYLAGLYMLLTEYLVSGKPLHLPPLIAYFELSAYSYITEENADRHIFLKSFSSNPDREIKLYDATDITFDSAEIIKTSSGRSCAIVAKKNGRELAIKVTPPSTVCKDSDVSKYKDLPTVEMDFSLDDDMIYKSKKEEFFAYVQSKPRIISWIYNPKITEAYPKIFSRSKKYYDTAQERMKKEAEERQRLEAERQKRLAEERQKRLEAERKRIEEAKLTPKQEENKPTVPETNQRPTVAKSKPDYGNGYLDVKDKFTQQDNPIKDRYGVRWIMCEVCGVISPSDKFSIYGGTNHVNLGTCANCSRNKRQ